VIYCFESVVGGEACGRLLRPPTSSVSKAS
jgi:hypothetical protein